MASLAELPTTFADTRDALQRVAVHIVARARNQGGAHSIGLRVTPGGFGTPEFGPDVTRVRVSSGLILHESGGPNGATSLARAIDGASLAELAHVALVDLAADLDVGHDTPPIGDVDEALRVDDAAARALAGWFAKTSAALDHVIASVPVAAAPTLVQVWPEHFDAALDLAAAPDIRVNLGGSPGDGFHADPYLYVGPWTEHRPGDAGFWNAPFGAVVGYRDLAAATDPVAAAAEFFRRGIELLAT
jgi:hypothetical protein